MIALMLDHETGYYRAIEAGDAELADFYKLLLQGELVAYNYASWHAYVYRNWLRLQARFDSPVRSFDADKRDFAGKHDAEEKVRVIKKLIDSVGTQSTNTLRKLVVDHPYTFRPGVVITVTSAADKQKRAALKQETENLRNTDLGVAVSIDDINKFLWNATKEGFWQAVEAVKEYYEVRQGILDDGGGPDVHDKSSQTGSGAGPGSGSGTGSGSGSGTGWDWEWQWIAYREGEKAGKAEATGRTMRRSTADKVAEEPAAACRSPSARAHAERRLESRAGEAIHAAAGPVQRDRRGAQEERASPAALLQGCRTQHSVRRASHPAALPGRRRGQGQSVLSFHRPPSDWPSPVARPVEYGQQRPRVEGVQDHQIELEGPPRRSGIRHPGPQVMARASI